MGNNRKIIIALLALFLLVAVGFAYWYFVFGPYTKLPATENGQRKFSEIVRPTKTVEDILEERTDIAERYEEKDDLDFGDEISGAFFNRFSDGNIFYLENGSNKTYPLTDEISISCTLQSLNGATSFDANLVVEANIFKREELTQNPIAEGEPIIVTKADIDGVDTVYGVVVSNEVCTKEENI